MVTNQKDKNLQQGNNNGGAIRIRTEEDYNGMLDLSLGSPTAAGSILPVSIKRTHPRQQLATGRVKQPRKNSPPQREGKSETIPPPFEWATDRRAMVRSLNDLLSTQIRRIKGEVQCKRCEYQYEMEFDLQHKFNEVGRFLSANKYELSERAPEFWKNPILPTCRYCNQENSAKPVIAKTKKAINWLFLLLGQMLGCCTLEQLRYFCKHTGNHRTGAKDRVLYLTYLTLCRQLDPTGPFDRD